MATKLDSAAILALRRALMELPPAASHPSAAQPPDEASLYSPNSHEAALDPDRALVIGNRGVGKSFWSAVLADPALRGKIAPFYPRLHLDRCSIVLGFHEAAGKAEGPAPSPELLRQLLGLHPPQAIWRGVLLQALGSSAGLTLPGRLRDLLPWIDANLEEAEAALRRADLSLHREQRRLVLLFDALDRLAEDWPTIRRLTDGALRLALDLRGFRALRLKLFMRSDQARDVQVFQFADASKIRAESVDLRWRRFELYGLLCHLLWSHREPTVREAFRACARAVLPRGRARDDSLPAALRDNEAAQEAVISALAGPFMGANHRRGKTFTWLYGHLADAFEETSPRSFLVALQRAGEVAKADLATVIDHHGIRAGVQAASQVRVDQLSEDYAWIRLALAALERIEVPCEAKTITEAWKKRTIVPQIRELVQRTQRLGPLELADEPQRPEDALLLALQNIGVLENRGDGRINVPDIFRVAAKMLRRGGVSPLRRP